MADEIRPTPRNPLFGLFSDFVNVPLDYMSDPRRTQQMQGIASFIRGTGVPSTLENLSYDPSGRGLFTGAGGLGGTTRMRPEAIEAALTLAPGVGPAARLAGRGAVATGRTLGPTAAGMTERYMQRQGMMPSLDVYQGTPYTFPPTARNPLGEFDASKIGTGEGAQVYGYGIYTAEAPAVAKGYQDRLGANLITVDGKPMDYSNPAHIAASIISDPNNAGLPGKQLASAIRYDPRGIVPFGAKPKVEEIAKALESGNLPKFSIQKGNLYKADLPDEMIPKMLDYDAAMSEQSLAVQKILLPYQKQIGGSFGTGEQTLKAIAFERRMKGLDDSPAAVAEQLRQMGIPGVKYLDEGSRNLANTWIVKSRQGGENVFSSKESAEAFLKRNPEDTLIPPKLTRNFVTFPGEEQNLRILQRNAEVASPMYTDPFGNTIADTTR